jgi:hypothetical protein
MNSEIGADLASNPAGTKAVTANRFYAYTPSTNAVVLSNLILRGFSGTAQHAGTGTLSQAQGGAYTVNNISTGTISTAMGANFVLSNNRVGGGGTITTLYGLMISDIINTGTIGSTYGIYIGDLTTGTQTNTPYSFYAADANARNFFAGNLGIGATAPVARLHVGDGTAPTLGADLASNSAFVQGNLEVDGKIYGSVDMSGPLVLVPPASALSVVAGTGVTPVANSFIRLVGNAGAVTVTANPAIAAGSDGQELVLLGTSDTNTVTFSNGNGLSLASGVSFTMGAGDTLRLIYDAANSVWRELSRANN